MDETGKKLLNLMFRPGETICVSPNKFGYHSIPLEVAKSDSVTLVPTEDSLAKRNITLEQGIERVSSSQLLLCALNPIKGYRNDLSCTAFRNFLVEMDYGPLKEQLAYAKTIGLPYSAVVFSGNKSLHFLISLDKDLPSEKVYRLFSQWILGVATVADQNTQNPSRSIRIPGAYREPDKKQILVEYRGPTKVEDLVAWLNQHPDAKPVIKEKKPVNQDDKYSFDRIKPWVWLRLADGLDSHKGRNKQWFSIACEFALAGYSEDDTLDKLKDFYQEDRDFKEKEWETSIKSAFKYIYERNR